MSMSSLPGSPSKIVFPNTSSLIKEALSEERRELPTPLARRDFKDTLARLSAQHEAHEEDNPESDTVYQALLKPIQVEEALPHPSLVAPPHSFTMPERPRTSPSKLALSVVLKPVAEHDDPLTIARHRDRLKLLAPLDGELTQNASSLRLPGTPQRAASEGSRLENVALSPTHTGAESVEGNEGIESIEKLEGFTLSLKPLEEEQARLAKEGEAPGINELRLDPVQASVPEQALKTLPAIPVTRALTGAPEQPSAIALPSPPRVETSGALLHNAVERTRLSERVTLSMENSPLGQKLELDIKDIFGNPLKLKITFEDQRARATCFGSQFHDPDQVEHVLDSVRTALEASGFELGDFIMHHHRDRRPDASPHDVQGHGSEGEEATPEPKKEIFRIVGIVNRIA